MPVLRTQHLHTVDKDNLLALDRYVRKEHYSRWLSPGDFTKDLATEGTDTEISSLIFADADDASATATFVRPHFWINGFYITKIYWTNSVTGSSTRFITELYGNEEGVDTSTSTQLFSVTTRINATALELEVTELTGITTPILSDYDLLSVFINRNGGHILDTSTGDFKLHGVNIEYHPIHTQ